MECISLGNSLKLLKDILRLESDRIFDKQLEEALDNGNVTKYLLRYNIHYDNLPDTWCYACNLFYLISNVMDQVDINLPENGLTVDQKNSVTQAMENCYRNSLEISVNKHTQVFYSTTHQSPEGYKKLINSLRMFNRLFSIIPGNTTWLDDAKLDFVIGLLAVITLKENQDDVYEFSEIFAQLTTKFTGDLVFKFLIMIKGFAGFTKVLQIRVHHELMKVIRAPNGFYTLCKNLLVRQTAEIATWKRYGMISKIIEGLACDKNYRDATVEDIFQTLDKCIKNDERDILGACVYVIHAFTTKMNNEDLNDYMKKKIVNDLTEIIQPENQVLGSVVMERQRIIDIINRYHVLFSPTSIKSIPTSVLSNHIAVLFDLYVILPESDERNKLANVITIYLNNRDIMQLRNVIQCLRLKEGDTTLRAHLRLTYFNEALVINEQTTEDDCVAFLHLLKNCNINLLIYQVFISLLNILSDVQTSGDNFLEYDVDEANLPIVLHRKFFKKLAILEPLQEMVQWPSLHTQLNEKPQEVLDVVKAVLIKNVEKNSADEQLMVIFFSIFKELVGKLKDKHQRKKMEEEILLIKDKCQSQDLREQIDEIFSVRAEVPPDNSNSLAYDEAMKNVQSSETYCKVYGADTLIKLLKKEDPQTMANRHTILALALQNLKETESYAYLNIIRLLVALTHIMNSEVIDALVVEYQNYDSPIDERLKVGEVIIKVTGELGQKSRSFKDSLLNCFLRGSRDSNNEFRTSSLANLGTITQILSYQIFNFFNELMQQLEIILRSDEYLPAKRAAAMVLSQVLAGIPSLLDFQEVLLPIYRLLKEIVVNEIDQQTRTHAGIGLDHLNIKTKDFLNPELKMSKEIKIQLDEDENPNKLPNIYYKKMQKTKAKSRKAPTSFNSILERPRTF